MSRRCSGCPAGATGASSPMPTRRRCKWLSACELRGSRLSLSVPHHALSEHQHGEFAPEGDGRREEPNEEESPFAPSRHLLGPRRQEGHGQVDSDEHVHEPQVTGSIGEVQHGMLDVMMNSGTAARNAESSTVDQKPLASQVMSVPPSPR